MAWTRRKGSSSADRRHKKTQPTRVGANIALHWHPSPRKAPPAEHCQAGFLARGVPLLSAPSQGLMVSVVFADFDPLTVAGAAMASHHLPWLQSDSDAARLNVQHVCDCGMKLSQYDRCRQHQMACFSSVIRKFSRRHAIMAPHSQERDAHRLRRYMTHAATIAHGHDDGCAGGVRSGQCKCACVTGSCACQCVCSVESGKAGWLWA